LIAFASAGAIEIRGAAVHRIGADDGASAVPDRRTAILRQAVAERGAVADDGDVCEVQRMHRILAEQRATCGIVSGHPECGAKTLLGKGAPVRRRRNMRDAGIVVDRRCGQAGAGAEVADHADHARHVQVAGRDPGPVAVVAIVLHQQFEAHRLSGDNGFAAVGGLYRELCRIDDVFGDGGGNTR
jgi:hypothetical protein